MSKIEEAGLELARKVISMSHSCDMSKLTQIELDRLNEVVDQARCMFVDSGEYNPKDDNVFIK